MKIKIFSLLLIIMSSVNVNGQKIKVIGNITDNNLNPIEGASVVITTIDEKKILTYCITNGKGHYNLTFKSVDKNFAIKISHIAYKSIIDSITNNNKDRNYKLVKKIFEFDEIVIKTKKVKDTMKIKTDSLVLTERSTLRDILDKTEGFNVSKNGGITFRGKKINKILINKKEVFVNQNKIALDNLEYDIMNDLELINNYKDKFNIDFNNFTSSVININTKKKFNGIFKLYGDGAYGYKNKYYIKLRSFYFSDKINMFLTNKTNNIGEKEFSFNDISNSFKSNSSIFFRNNFTPFFSEDDLLKNSFDSNTSITLRKEEKRIRLGFVLYYNNMNQRKNTYQTTEKNNLLLKQEEKNLFNTGQSVVSRFLFNRTLDRNMALSYKFDFIYSSTKDSNTLDTHNISPVEVNIEEENKNIPKSFLYATKLRLKKKINSKIIISTSFENNRENSENYFETNYKITNQHNFNQFFSFSNQSSKLDLILDYKFNNYFTTSIGSESVIIKDKLKYKKKNVRKGYMSNLILQLRGQNKKLEYKLKVVPQFYHLSDNKNKLEINTTTSYKLNESNRINVNYSQNNNFIDIYKSIDTLALSYNERLINTIPLKNEISTTKSFNLGYNYSSIIRTQSFNIGYSYAEDFNYLEPILESIENNIFYYKNHLIDKKSISKFTISAGKGFYFSKKYHLLRINGKFSNTLSKFPAFVLGEEKEYLIKNFQYTAKIGIEPKDIFFDEMFVKLKVNNQKTFLENKRINNNNSYIYYTTLSKKTNSMELNLSLGQSLQKNDETVFRRPFFNIDGTLKLNKKLNIFIKGKYLFHLFNYKDNYLTSFNVSTNGNYIFSSYNKNNLNYLIFGISYKL